MFHLQHDPDFYSEILKGSDDVHNCDYTKIQAIVNNGPGVQMTKELKQELVDKSFEVLDEFKDSDSKWALNNIVKVL